MNNPILFATLLGLATIAGAIEINEPADHSFTGITFTSVDDDIRTLGTPEFVIDLSAARDDLLELKARRSELKLGNGKPISVFGYNKDINIMIGASDPVKHLSVVGTDQDNILALFYDQDNAIIAPKLDQIQLFDLDFKPLAFTYIPAQKPTNQFLDVDILIDVSGSMENALAGVTDATRQFMKELPTFTRCSILTFGTTVERLTDHDPSKLKPCPNSLDVLMGGLKASGATALHRVIKESLEGGNTKVRKLPKLSILLSDGVDTENPEITLDQLKSLKDKSNSKVLIFWAGSYDPDYLKGLADIETISDYDIESDLSRFFTSIGISINGMQSITIK